MQFQTLQLCTNTANTFELSLKNAHIATDDPNFRFILYEEQEKNKYRFVK